MGVVGAGYADGEHQHQDLRGTSLCTEEAYRVNQDSDLPPLGLRIKIQLSVNFGPCWALTLGSMLISKTLYHRAIRHGAD